VKLKKPPHRNYSLKNHQRRSSKDRLSTNDRIVYSTDTGRRCPNCLRALATCVCRKGTPGKAGDGIVRVSRETQGRKGKGVTVVSGLGLAPAGLEALATELKKRCGSGGTVDADRIEIQGEHRDTLVAELSARGWTVRRAGG
jgi:translation initiation factor 1